VNERRKVSVPTLTVSLWAHLKADEESFRNPTYRKYAEVSGLALQTRQFFLFFEVEKGYFNPIADTLKLVCIA